METIYVATGKSQWGRLFSRYIDVQKQSDCRLYAIAFATALCFGKQPSGQVFDQSVWGKRLHHCLENSKMEMFMVLKIKSVMKVHCLCRMPSLSKEINNSSRCHEWYPTVDIDPKYFEKKMFCSLLKQRFCILYSFCACF